MEPDNKHTRRPVSGKSDENLDELRQNSAKYALIQYVLGSIVEHSKPEESLALILQEIATLTAGKLRLFVEIHKGIWEGFSLEHYEKHRSWLSRYLIDEDLYSAVTRFGDVIYYRNLPERNRISEDIRQHLVKSQAESLVLVLLRGKPNIVIEVQDFIIPDRADRYLEAIREFVLPLKLSLHHTILLEESERARRRADLLLDLLFHDIRNSLNNMQVSLELLEMRWDDKQRSRENLLQAMDCSRTANRLLDRVKRILTMMPKDDLSSYDLCTVFETCVATVRANHRDITTDIAFPRPSTCQIKVLGNDLIYDLFENLLSNAVKAMKGKVGKITIEADVWDINPAFAHIKIIDQGSGMPEKIRPQVAGRFLTESTSGIGLGLSIVMRILEEIDGYLWYENRVPDDISKGTIANVALRIDRK